MKFEFKIFCTQIFKERILKKEPTRAGLMDLWVVQAHSAWRGSLTVEAYWAKSKQQIIN
jgi:hypothetical protein